MTLPDHLPESRRRMDELKILQLQRLDAGITGEFNVINARMSWLVIGEAFIFGAFATVLIGYSPTHPLKVVMETLLYSMPLLGVAVAVPVDVSIRAAHLAADYLKKERDELESHVSEHLRIAKVGVGGDLPAIRGARGGAGLHVHRRGNAPAVWVPKLIAVSWIVVLVVLAFVLGF